MGQKVSNTWITSICILILLALFKSDLGLRILVIIMIWGRKLGFFYFSFKIPVSIRRVKTTLKTKDQVKGLTLYDFKTYDKLQKSRECDTYAKIEKWNIGTKQFRK